MEQPHIFEMLSEIMIRLCIDRHEILVDYLAISQKYVRNAVTLKFIYSTEDRSRMRQHHLPLIECVKALHHQHLIICNFKDD